MRFETSFGTVDTEKIIITNGHEDEVTNEEIYDAICKVTMDDLPIETYSSEYRTSWNYTFRVRNTLVSLKIELHYHPNSDTFLVDRITVIRTVQLERQENVPLIVKILLVVIVVGIFYIWLSALIH